jgi:hypothetical protein
MANVCNQRKAEAKQQKGNEVVIRITINELKQIGDAVFYEQDNLQNHDNRD